MTMSECWGFLKDGFINVFDVGLVEGQLSRECRQLALKLKRKNTVLLTGGSREKSNPAFLCDLVFRMRIK